jgi:hypothetical protein
MTSDFATRSRQFHDALYEALSGPDTVVTDTGALDRLSQLVVRCRAVAGEHEHVGEALDALDAITRREDVDAGLSEAAALFASPQRFREALYFARCLDHDPTAALELMGAQGYVAAATVPVAAYAGLAAEQAALLDTATFATLWREPGRLRWMIDMADAWRRDYVPAYQLAHAAYNKAVADIAGSADALQNQVEALEKLNRLRKLGAPVAEVALLRFHELEQLYACAANDAHLGDALQVSPTCDQCGFRIGDEAPAAEAEQVSSAIDAALAMQMARLQQRVVGRLRAQPVGRNGGNVDRFVEAVQTSDVAGLAQVLDEGLVGFIEDVLDTPEPRVNLIDRLAREHPEVTTDNLAAVVESFRRIAAEELAQNGGRLRIGVEEEPA